MLNELHLETIKQTHETQIKIKQSIMHAYLDAEKLYALCKLAHIKTKQTEETDYLKLLYITCENLLKAYDAIDLIIKHQED